MSTCSCFTRGVVRKSRATYLCEACGQDVTLAIILLSDVLPESAMPPVIRPAPPVDAAIRKPLSAHGEKCSGFFHQDFLNHQ